eukprot:6185615-Pleurochrysis_carterae.AAC.2
MSAPVRSRINWIRDILFCSNDCFVHCKALASCAKALRFRLGSEVHAASSISKLQILMRGEWPRGRYL